MRHKWCIKGTRRLKETPHFNNNQKGVYSRNPVCSPVQPGQQPACPAHSSVNRSPTGEVRRTTRSTGRQPGSSPEHKKSGCRPVNQPTDRRVRRTARSTGRQPGVNRPPTGGAPGRREVNPVPGQVRPASAPGNPVCGPVDRVCREKR